jgi:hypothetical protein
LINPSPFAFFIIMAYLVNFKVPKTSYIPIRRE